jgi:hypothetical protein
MTRTRPATPDDAEQIGAVHEAAIRGLAAEQYEDHEIEAWVGPDDEDADPDDEDEQAGYERLQRTTHELRAGIEIDCVRMRKTL